MGCYLGKGAALVGTNAFVQIGDVEVGLIEPTYRTELTGRGDQVFYYVG